jgi:hypothetical protein
MLTDATMRRSTRVGVGINSFREYIKWKKCQSPLKTGNHQSRRTISDLCSYSNEEDITSHSSWPLLGFFVSLTTLSH